MSNSSSLVGVLVAAAGAITLAFSVPAQATAAPLTAASPAIFATAMLVDCPKDKCASNSTCEDADRDKVCLVSYDADNNPSCKTEACVQPVGN